MKEGVAAFRSLSPDANKHFFQVKLEGFTDAPAECESPRKMYDFVSQIAPVPYAADFPYHVELQKAAKECEIPIEEVRITIKNGIDKPTSVTKRYGASYEFRIWDSHPYTSAPYIIPRLVGGGLGLARRQSRAPTPTRALAACACEYATFRSTGQRSSEIFFEITPSRTRAFKTISSERSSLSQALSSQMLAETVSKRMPPGSDVRN